MTEHVGLISTAQAAELSGLSQPQIQKLCRDGVIPAQKVGSTYVIPAEWAAQFADTVGPGVAALAAGVSRQTIYTAIADGTLVTVMGNRIAKSSLAEYIRAREGEKWLNKPYLWGMIYSCMLNLVKSAAPGLARGYEKNERNFCMTPGLVFPTLHDIYIKARGHRWLSEQNKVATDFRLTLMLSEITPDDFKRRMGLEEQSDVQLGIYREKKVIA